MFKYPPHITFLNCFGIYIFRGNRQTNILPSLKKARPRSIRSNASGAISVLWTVSDMAPEIAKNRYMVLCCQFMSCSQR